MESFEFFLLPDAVFVTGIIIWFLLRLSPQRLERLHGDVQIGAINKQTLVCLSKGQRLSIRKLLGLATVTCTVSTAIIAIVFIKFFSLTVVNFLICLSIQLCVFILIGRPFYKKMYGITKSDQ